MKLCNIGIYLRSKIYVLRGFKGYKGGFWFPILKDIIKFIYEKFSICFYFQLFIAKHRTIEKSPPWVAECYSLTVFILALVWSSLIYVDFSLFKTTIFRNLGAGVAIYFILEIFFFSLKWTFVDRDPIHSTRRALAGFILNIFEVAIYSTIALILLDCTDKTKSQYDIIYDNLSDSFNLTLYLTDNIRCCKVVAHIELITVTILITIAIAALVGGVLRKEVKKSNGN